MPVFSKKLNTKFTLPFLTPPMRPLLARLHPLSCRRPMDMNDFTDISQMQFALLHLNHGGYNSLSLPEYDFEADNFRKIPIANILILWICIFLYFLNYFNLVWCKENFINSYTQNGYTLDPLSGVMLSLRYSSGDIRIQKFL